MIIPKSLLDWESMTTTQRYEFLNYETCRYEYPGYNGILIYEQYDLVVRYERDSWGRLNNIIAESYKYAKQRAIMEALANWAIVSMN